MALGNNKRRELNDNNVVCMHHEESDSYAEISNAKPIQNCVFFLTFECAEVKRCGSTSVHLYIIQFVIVSTTINKTPMQRNQTSQANEPNECAMRAWCIRNGANYIGCTMMKAKALKI